MAEKKVKASPKQPPRDGRGMGQRNPECERNMAGLPRLYKNRKARPGYGRPGKS